MAVTHAVAAIFFALGFCELCHSPPIHQCLGCIQTLINGVRTVSGDGMRSKAAQREQWSRSVASGEEQGGHPLAPGDGSGWPGSGPDESLSVPFILLAGADAGEIDRIAGLIRPDCRSVAVDGIDAAFRQACAQPPDLLLVDVDLSDGNGIELCRRMRADQRTEGIPILLISAVTDTALYEMAFRNGASDVVARPLRRAELLARLRHQLRQRRREKALLKFALHDSLTDLPNRSLCMDRLHQALLQDQRDGRVTALLFIDLDKFKLINDSFGHEAGDAVLREVARRLRAGVRAGDTVGRMGGDEFVIVLRGLPDPASARKIALDLLSAFHLPFDWQGEAMILGISIGLAQSPRDGRQARALLARADAAMYLAKQQGRGRLVCEGDPGGSGA